MIDEEVKKEIEKAIADHEHTGNVSKRVNWFDIFGQVETLTAAPTGTPQDVAGQLKIYNGRLYFYNFATNVWQSSGSTSTLFDYYTDAGNSGTSVTDLYSSTIAANTLANNGDKLEIMYSGEFVASATATKEITLRFGGSLFLDSGAIVVSPASDWVINATLIRVDASTIRAATTLALMNGPANVYTNYVQLTPDLTSANILKIEGQAAGVGAATNDIVAKMGTVKLVTAA